MKLLVLFLKKHLEAELLFAVFAAVFAVVFSLYDLETEAVLYAVLLCTVAAAVFAAVSFLRFRQKYLQRQRLLDEAGMLAAPLPEASDPEEKQFTELTQMLRENCSQAQVKYKNDRSDMLDYFTTWVHQIKIPISVMQITLDSYDSDEHAQLSAELMRINRYVEMVLCYFRLDEYAPDLVAQSVNVDSVIRQSVRKYAPIFIRKRLRLEYEGTQLTAVTDEKWLGFIMEQLLSNSLKYTDKGSVSISVQGRSITVSDTGMGIAPQDVPRIFERGYTGLNGRTENNSTGLGLYLVKKACKKLGAAIDVQSEVGKGTSVTVTLPEGIFAE